MESKTTMVRKIFVLLENGKLKEAAAGLSDDFTFTGLAPKAMNKKQFLEFMQTLLAAFPLWRFNSSHLKEEGDTVKMKLFMMGINSGELDIPAFGVTGVPATNKDVVLPATEATAVLEGDTIAEFTIADVPGGGVEGILKQLGIDEKGAAKR